VADFYAPVDPDVLRRERARARLLRASGWWKRRLGAGICHYCRGRVGAAALTMDHLVPLGRGGRSVRGNVVPACKDCNTRKRTLLPVEWQEYLDRLRDITDE
jgi:5-methylcytosine-specific restriction endonuclease McrA